MKNKRIEIAKPQVGFREAIAAARVVYSGRLTQSNEVARFEHEFSEIALGDSYESVAVNSGTNGLVMSLLALGVGPGDEVIVPSFTFAATANAVVLAGATPVFADIDIDTFNLDIGSVRSRITSRTAAIIFVHLYGNPSNVEKFAALARSAGIFLVEDAAQAHLADVGGQKVGTFGDAAVFSFYPTKNMTTGEGGIVTTNAPEILRKLRLLRNQGMEVRYANEIAGFNNRMSDIHAAIGRVQLRQLETRTQRRRSIAARFDREISGFQGPRALGGANHVYHQYTLTTEHITRETVLAKLEKAQIGASVYYPTPVHLLPSFKGLAGLEDLPQTIRASQSCFSIPVRPNLKERDVVKIIDCLNEIVRGEK